MVTRVGAAARDSQVVEITGRNWLLSELYRSGVEVARPERDHGIDLIAFFDLDGSKRFIARPIQMKASSQRMFGIWRPLEKFPDLLIAYVWNLADPPNTICHCLTYEEALRVAEQMNWTKTSSWTKGGAYVTNSPGSRLTSLLDPFKMTPAAWRLKLGAYDPMLSS
jgi:hypothetical protein